MNSRFFPGRPMVDTTKRRPSRRPPPNYFSRRVQWRIMALVAALMTIVVMMEQAADPATWAWMWGPAPAGATSIATAAPNTTAPPPVHRADPVISDAFSTGPRFQDAASPTPQDPMNTQIAADAWREIWRRLPKSHAERLLRALRADRLGTPMSPADRRDWTETLALLDEEWQRYTDQARESLKGLDDQQAPPGSRRWAGRGRYGPPINAPPWKRWRPNRSYKPIQN